MPRIFDNIESPLLPALTQTLEVSDRADFCVGYFNLRGWKKLDTYIERWGGEPGKQCRLLIGMQRMPEEDARNARKLSTEPEAIDNQTAVRLKKRLAEEFRRQLTFGVPNNQDEAGLRRLARQIREKKVVVKLFLRHTLHAKLYLLFRSDPNNPVTAFLGSSNLTVSGLSEQGELNVDVLDQDACQKLSRWFEDRWSDRFCMDISEELAQIIEDSWAREDLIPPYHIYVKMAYHLSQEARDGLAEFRIPRELDAKLFEFQKAAVKIAAHHLHKRNGVLIGDVVGLGKTLMATALARMFEDDLGLETLIISPKNLVPMWTKYRDTYHLRAKVLSISRVMEELPELPRFRVVVIDESHNLRNREGKRFRVILDYIRKNDSRCVLLTATPYNKTYLDLANQLRLFLDEERDIGIRPEMLLREIGEPEFIRRHQCPLRSLAAFEKSEYPDDWRELMRLYLVRRTRSFVKTNYAQTDPETGRKYLPFQDGTKSFFPERVPRTLKFPINESDPNDQYAKLYAQDVVDIVAALHLPRYGLGQYVATKLKGNPPTAAEREMLDNLGRAGQRLIGFCRTNLFKRLESSGMAFVQSLKRHVIRNNVYLYAIENGLPLPIGTQEAELLDSRFTDEDADDILALVGQTEEENEAEAEAGNGEPPQDGCGKDLARIAEATYKLYRDRYQRRFKWLDSRFFKPINLKKHLQEDAASLCRILDLAGEWQPERDTKLNALSEVLTHDYPARKVLVFSQFADTVAYLTQQLQSRGIAQLAGVTGSSSDPTAIAQRFSPKSNDYALKPGEKELRVVIATDVLSEGQNLQDCSIVINYDLPWAIIRLIQRAGRVDRIGQLEEKIVCGSFLPAEGVEKLLRLRSRLRTRLTENAEVVGTDESFFEDDRNDGNILDLYNEKAGILDGDDDTEVDLASYAYQIWKNAIDRDKNLERKIKAMSDVVFGTRPHFPTAKEPEGVLVYLQTAEGNDALAWVDRTGKSVTESQYAILKAAECSPDTPALPRTDDHHALVQKGVEHIAKEERSVGGQLGRPSGARYKVYERMKNYVASIDGTLFYVGEGKQQLDKAIDAIYRSPLLESAKDTLNRHIRLGITNERLAELIMSLHKDDMLVVNHETESSGEPRIICSMGLRKPAE